MITVANSDGHLRDSGLDAEILGLQRSLIATMLLSRECQSRLIDAGLVLAMFDGEIERALYTALREHWAASEDPPSPHTLREHLGPKRAGYVQYIDWYTGGLLIDQITSAVGTLRRHLSRRDERTATMRAKAALDRGDPEAAEDYLSDAREHRAAASGGIPVVPRPTTKSPLESLPSLGPIATLGRSRLIELADAPINYAWVDVSPVGTITLLAGAPGEGKTTLLFLLLTARANLSGIPVRLLEREVKPAPRGQYIVLIEGEHGERSAARKLVRSMRLLSIDDSALERIIVVARKAVRIGDPAWQDVIELVKAGLVSDIALDTIARVAPEGSDSNDEGDQVRLFDRVAQAIEQAPTNVDPPTCWAVGHTRKGASGDSLDDVSGSTQRVGQVDSVLQVKATRRDGRVVSTRVVFTKLREEPDDYPTPVSFEITSAQLLTLAAETKQSTPTAEYEKRAAVIEELVRKNIGCSRAYLRNNSGIGATYLDSTIEGLIEERRIQRDPPQPKRGQKHKFYPIDSSEGGDE